MKRGHRHREDGLVKVEAEVGDMQLQVKERLGPPEAGRGRKDSSLGPSGGVWPC